MTDSTPSRRMTLHEGSRPLSPSVSSFSRLRGNSKVPVRVRGAKGPFSRTPSPLSVSPSTPDAYFVTEEKLLGLRHVNRLSREGGVHHHHHHHPPGYFTPKMVDIIPPSGKKATSQQLATSPPSTSSPAVPLATVHSQAVLPTFDFDDLQPQSSPSPGCSTIVTPPSSPQLILPPRSDSRLPWLHRYQDDSLSFHSSGYGDGHEFDDFSGVVEPPDINEAETDIDDSFEEDDGTGMGKGLVRYDSPMQLVIGPAIEDAVLGASNAEEDGFEERPEQKTEATVHSASRSQDLADGTEVVPSTTEDPHPHTSSPIPTIAIAPLKQPVCFPRHGGLAGVDTPGKMRATRAAMQQSEPSFARTTASSAAKSSAPPDIPRVKSLRDPQIKLKYPAKKRSVLEKLGHLFHKGAKRDKEPESPPTTRLRIGRDATNNKLKVKRQSEATALEAFRSPAPSPSPQKMSERKPSPMRSLGSQVAPPVRSKIPSPAFGTRGVSPVSNAAAALASSPLPRRASGESTGFGATTIPVDGSQDSTLEFCRRLMAQAVHEHDFRRQNKLLTLAQSLNNSMECARETAKWAATASQAADLARKYYNQSKGQVVAMQKTAARKIGQ